MNNCFSKYDLDISEVRTPTDNRTIERKDIIKRVKNISIPYHKHEYGIFFTLRISDVDKFILQLHSHN